MSALRNIDHCANYLKNLSARTQNWMADAMNMFDCSIEFDSSELDVVIHFLDQRPITCHPELVAVFWVYSL